MSGGDTLAAFVKVKSSLKDIRRGLQLCQWCSALAVDQPSGKLMVCSKCQNAHYCSRECQAKHWKNGHKEWCKINRHAKATIQADLDAPPNFDKIFQQWREVAKVYAPGLLYYKALDTIPPLASASSKDRHKRIFGSKGIPGLCLLINLKYDAAISYFHVVESTLVTMEKLRQAQPELAEQWATQHNAVWDTAVRGNARVIGVSFTLAVCDRTMAIVPSAILDDVQALMANLGVNSYQDALDHIHGVSNVVRNGNDTPNESSRKVFHSFTEKLLGQDALFLFLAAVMRVHTPQPRHLTHVISFVLEMDDSKKGVKGIKSYSVMTVEEAKQWMSECENPQDILAKMDLETSPELLKSRKARPSNILLPVCLSVDSKGWEKFKYVLPYLYEVDNAGIHGTPVGVAKADKIAKASFKKLQDCNYN